MEKKTQLLTEKEVVAQLQMSFASVRRWRVSGGGPPWVKLGRNVRYPADGLESWIQNKSREQQDRRKVRK